VTQGGGVTALTLRGIGKRFGGTVALDHVDLDVRLGSVHALLGENGAGKSTLTRIAFGMIAADAGEVEIFGTRMSRPSVRRSTDAGVGMVHQHHSLSPSLTALENLALGGRGRFRPADTRALFDRTTAASALRLDPDALVRDLSIVEQQRLEILKALSRGARLLILDEPTALLAPAEIDELLRWVRAFADRGGGVVFVTHKLREALAIADTVTVLRRGRVVHHGPAAPDSEDALARAILDESLQPASRASTSPPGEPVVRADAIDITDARKVTRVRAASFELRRHEVIAIAGIEGSGHGELLSALAGLRRAEHGALTLPPRIAFIPADRLREGLIGQFSLAENVALRGLGSRRGLMPWRDIIERTGRLMSEFGIAAPSARSAAASLSGGNQQRLVIARELEHEVDLVVAINPSRGLDLRATAFVHDRLRDAAARGAAVVVYSSDLDELLAIATRVLAVFHGEVREVPANRDAVGRAILGAA
jgi:simple sugar transport system ATP-binding protein